MLLAACSFGEFDSWFIEEDTDWLEGGREFDLGGRLFEVMRALCGLGVELLSWLGWRLIVI